MMQNPVAGKVHGEAFSISRQEALLRHAGQCQCMGKEA
jgi:hypothetical protein